MAVQEGADYADLTYSGNFEFVNTEMYMTLNHEIAPADKALGCMDCHGDGGLDWADLGYPLGDPMAHGGRDAQLQQDHTGFAQLAGPFTTGQEVTAQCLTCHAEAGEQMKNSFHWNWEGNSPGVVGMEDEKHGKKDTINNFCIAVASNEGRCTQCHAGYGWTSSDDFDFTDSANIDCLVCHADKSLYKKEPSANGGGGLPHASVDLANAAKSVSRPARDNCGACHFTAGGGDNVKKGDLASSLTNPTPSADVHMGNGFTCQACHKTNDHQIAGRSLHSVPVEGSVDCADCHSEKPHTNAQLNTHSEHVACQTCHIPAFSRQLPTKTEWYWEQAGLASYTCDEFTFGDDKDTITKPCFDQKKGTFVWEMNVTPTYAWYNFKYDRMFLGDTYTPEAGKPVSLAKPVSEITDLKAKLFPFKVMKGNQPTDSDNNYLLPPHLYGTAGGATPFWGNWDWATALTEGTTFAGLTYSGNYEFVETEMYMTINHEVAPADQALGCMDCHGKLDWAALGYTGGDPMTNGGRKAQLGL